VNGKKTGKKDLALQAIAHGGAYVASIALGANDAHALRTIIEAESFPGPSLIIAYSHCIAHGYDMRDGAEQQQAAVKSGYWPLFHFNPMKPQGQRFVIDSKAPELSLADFMYNENRFKIVKSKDPQMADEFLREAEEAIAIHWNRLNTLKGL
jgi:pyruvate-ferredoxin/flavodoxin oxidoreductase